ncbi:MAG: RHS repeat-associated core domain-containing protein [Parachlamydiales bacterium]
MGRLRHPRRANELEFALTEVIKPNGNRIVYSYDTNKRLIKIATFNASREQCLSWAQFSYCREEGDEVSTVTTSDRQRVDYHYETQRGVAARPRRQLILIGVSINGIEAQQYVHYQHRIIEHRQLDGGYLRTQYFHDGRSAIRHRRAAAYQVAEQWAPVGEKGEERLVARLEYAGKHDGDSYTDAWDANGHRTRFHYSELGKIHRIEAFEQGVKRRSFEQLEWNGANLGGRCVCDGQGRKLLNSAFLYDERHNVIQEVESGAVTGHTSISPELFTKVFTYSSDGFNNLLTEAYDRTLIICTYWEGTDLLKTKSTYEGEQLRLEEHYEYDGNASLARYTRRDGYRTYLKKITARDQQPGFGLPEWIEEFVLDGTSEVLQRREHLHYSDRHEVIRCDIYDGEALLRYSLHFEYDALGRVIQSADAEGQVVLASYDGAGHLVERITPTTHTRIHHDLAGRPAQTAITDTVGGCQTTTNFYDPAGHLVGSADPYGNVTRFSVNRDGKPLRTTYPAVEIEGRWKNATREATYDAWGNLTSSKDENGNVTRFTYNGRNQPIGIEYADGGHETFRYSLKGEVESHTDLSGLTTHYIRDYRGRPIIVRLLDSEGRCLKETTHAYEGDCLAETCHPDGTVTTYTYNACGQLVEENFEGRRVRYTYDALKRPIEKQLCDETSGTTFRYHYDLLDRLVREEIYADRLLSWKRWEYDFDGHVVSEATERGSTQTRFGIHGPLSIVNPEGHETTISYGLFPREERRIDPLGLCTLSSFNARGAITSIKKISASGADLASSHYHYDLGMRKIAEVHLPTRDGQSPYRLRWGYDPRGRPVRLTEGRDGQQRTTRYSYDEAGRLTSTIKPSGTTINRTYDALSRLSTLSGADFADTFRYDLADRLLSVESERGVTTRIYNTRGDLVSETLETGWTLSYSHGEQGEITEVSLPDDSTLSYLYQGPHITRFERQGVAIDYQYSLDGRLARIHSPLESTSLTYDHNGRVTAIENELFAQQITYDPVGNVTLVATQAPLSTTTAAYAYDPLYQLTHESGQTSYTYDSLNNRLTKDDNSYLYDPFNQLTQAGEISFSYDPDGLTTKIGSQYHTYDSRGRLTSIEQENWRVEYAYDPFHRRLTETRYTRCPGGWQPTSLDHFLYIDQQEIGALNEEGEVSALRAPGPGLKGSLLGIALLELRGEPFLPTPDFRGSVALIRSQDGVGEVYHYDAFGNHAPSAFQNPYRFLGKRVDDQTGHIFFGRRYYLPRFGRWLTPDPRGYEDGPNLYAYCHNCPLTLIDLLGLLSEDKDHKQAAVSLLATAQKWRDRPNPYNATAANFDKAVIPYFVLQGESTVLDLGLPKLPNGTSIHYQNGINTTRGQAMDNMRYLSKICGGHNVICEYNPTQGGVSDVRRVMVEMFFGVATKAVEVTVNSLRADWNQSKKIGGMLDFSHSAGTTVQRNALMLMTTEERERIYPVCLSPSSYIRRELNSHAVHYASKRDIVPHLDRRGKAMCRETTTWLDPVPGGGLPDHELQSPTLEDPIERSYQGFMKRHGWMGPVE